MSLEAGTRLGPYEVLGPLGQGGMGEVYRAHDTRLKRDVAIKILPDAFAADAERVARFQREAEVLASLSHQNIGGIFGIEQINPASPGGHALRALILELIDGPTLADRIAQGPIPVAEALPIAQQIADALEAAHEQGVVHRDLKPANIKLAADGRVKVLDFGLAKALGGDASSANLSMSPTITSPAMTARGIILGTAAYMSPEQARGKPVDKRSDIWAFGCVLYEMLTGARAFEGEDVSDTMAAILRGEPAWSALPKALPPAVSSILHRCLEKDRRKRLPDISLVRFVLENPAEASWIGAATPSAVASTASPRWKRALPWAAVAVLAVSLAALLVRDRTGQTATPASPLRITGQLGADITIDANLGAAVALSPDGRTMAFSAVKNLANPPDLYVRRLDQLQATLLAGTNGALNPFFSPDGQWIGFFAQGKLKKVAVTGGAAVALCDAPSGRGGSWSESGFIVFAPSSTAGNALQRVSADGGKPEPVSDLMKEEGGQRWPQVLPGGKAVLYSSATSGAVNYQNGDLVVRTLADGKPKVIQRGAYFGRYVSSGHLLYLREGTMFAAPFDVNRLELTGPAVPAIESINGNPSGGVGQFAVSDNGTVVYIPGQVQGNTAPIRWLDQTGRTSFLRSIPSNWSNPAFSPDGRKLAVDISDGTQVDVWVYDWERDTLSRLTFDPTDDVMPIWTPDGSRIVFASRRGDKSALNLYWQRADGTGEVQRLTDSKKSQGPSSWHPSGTYLSYFESGTGTGADVWILPMEGSESAGWKPGKPQVFLQTPLQEVSAMFSPDGRWLAYLSNESGNNELYVRPFVPPGAPSGTGGKWQISTAAADDPSWSRTKPELFFLSTTDLRLMVASYSVDGLSFRAEKPKVWSDARISVRPRAPSRDLDLHPDGKRFAVASAEDEDSAKQDKAVFVFNFLDELRRTAPVKK